MIAPYLADWESIEPVPSRRVGKFCLAASLGEICEI